MAIATSLARTARPLWDRACLVMLLTLVGTGCDSLNPPDPVLGVALDGYEVRQTTISDGLVQAGERVIVDLFVTNTSGAAYQSINSEATSPLADGEILLGVVMDSGFLTETIAELGAGQTARLVAQFTVEPNTPAGTPIPVALTLTASELEVTHTWSLTTSALPYLPTVEGVDVVGDTDGDGQVEPGEEAAIRFVVRSGSEAPTYLCAQASTTLAQVTFVGPSGVGCNDEDGRTAQIRFRASSTLAPGTALPFVITVLDALGNTWDTPVTVPLG